MSLRLSLQVFEDSTKASMMADWSGRAVGTTYETDEHGYSYLQAFIQMTKSEAFRFYNDVPFAHIVLGDGAQHAFEGRIEDREILDGGLRIGAYGYQRALHDVLYTALWSTVDYNKWRPITDDEISIETPELYQFDFQSRIYIAPRVGETFSNGADVGAVGFKTPNLSNTDIGYLEFDYEMLLPSGWGLFWNSYAWDWSSGASENAVAATGSPQSASRTEVIAANKQAIEIGIYNNTGSDSTPTGDSGDWYCKLTDVRVTQSDATIYGQEIINDIVGYVNGINSSQLSSNTALINNPTVDLPEIWLEDVIPAAFLSDLARLGDNSSPPDIWEWGVWNDQKLHFREKGGESQDWYTDVQSLKINSALDTLENYIYAVYEDRGGETKRTAAAQDTESQAKYGVTRYGYVGVGANDATHPTTIRDARLEDSKDVSPRGEITISIVYNISGAMVPSYLVRAGDNINIRNLPVTGLPSIDRIRSFRISRTSYDIDNNVLRVTPEFSPPSLMDLVAINTAFDNPRKLGQLRKA